MGDGTYMASHEDNSINASLGAVKAASLKDAADFCRTKSQGFSIVNSTEKPRSFGSFPQYSVQFKCGGAIQ